MGEGYCICEEKTCSHPEKLGCVGCEYLAPELPEDEIKCPLCFGDIETKLRNDGLINVCIQCGYVED